jgi:hypothetical protein
LIEAKIKDWIDFKQKNIEISKTTEEIAQKFFAGQPVSDEIII